MFGPIGVIVIFIMVTSLVGVVATAVKYKGNEWRIVAVVIAAAPFAFTLLAIMMAFSENDPWETKRAGEASSWNHFTGKVAGFSGEGAVIGDGNRRVLVKPDQIYQTGTSIRYSCPSDRVVQANTYSCYLDDLVVNYRVAGPPIAGWVTAAAATSVIWGLFLSLLYLGMRATSIRRQTPGTPKGSLAGR